MYLGAPINAQIFKPRILISAGRAEVEIDVEERFFHAAHAVHGAVYFKLLDDAAFFAANSLEPMFFVLTSAFTTYLTRPVSTGLMKSVGQVVQTSKSQFIAESVVYDHQGKEAGRGSGIFVRSKMPLSADMGYVLS